jgi:hypothetical protein
LPAGESSGEAPRHRTRPSQRGIPGRNDPSGVKDHQSSRPSKPYRLLQFARNRRPNRMNARCRFPRRNRTRRHNLRRNQIPGLNLPASMAGPDRPEQQRSFRSSASRSHRLRNRSSRYELFRTWVGRTRHSRCPAHRSRQPRLCRLDGRSIPRDMPASLQGSSNVSPRSRRSGFSR